MALKKPRKIQIKNDTSNAKYPSKNTIKQAVPHMNRRLMLSYLSAGLASGLGVSDLTATGDFRAAIHSF